MPCELNEMGWYFKEAETFINEVLDRRNRILGAEHPDSQNYHKSSSISLSGKIQRGREAEDVSLDARNRTIEVEDEVNESKV